MWLDRSTTVEQGTYFSSYAPSRSNGMASVRTQPVRAQSFDRDEEKRQDDDVFKEEVIKDILCQIDYRAALQRGVVDLRIDELAEAMRRLPTRALVAWYEAFLYIRSELMFSGYELNGFKILDRPYDAIRKLIENDPNFDIRQYIF